MNISIPTTMQAVTLGEIGGPLTVRQIPVPEPGPGEVLIRMAASPINPSDPGFISGGHGFQKLFPLVPGFEGSGTVVFAGPDLLPPYRAKPHARKKMTNHKLMPPRMIIEQGEKWEPS